MGCGMAIVVGLAGRAEAADAASVPDDPYAWLEDVDGDKALAWVREQNEASTSELGKGADYLQRRIRAILDSDEKIPYVAKRADFLYNFWQDKEHERGLWRRTTPEEYRKPEPAWETVLDVDALAAADGKSWVWHGASCLPPEYRRCIVSLSPGGSDADVKREFDTVDKTFVPGGFELPEAKSNVDWIDADRLFVTAAMGPGTETTSGYGRIVQEWKRGTPLSEAAVVFEGQETDVSVGGWRDHTEGFEREFVSRSITFYEYELFLREDGQLVKIDVPADAIAWAWREWLVVEPKTDWTVGDTTWKAGSLLAAPFDAYLAGERKLQALFVPTDTTALSGVSATRSTLVLDVMDNVKSRLYVARPKDGTWTQTPMAGVSEMGNIWAQAVDPDRSDEVWLGVTDFLTPPTLSLASVAEGAGPPEVLKSLPAQFDATGLVVSQHHATSADGTQIPYFQVSRAGLRANGKNPTVINGYGGFEVSMTPQYASSTGAAWLERGGVYVVANIRGGGEFGPRWHRAALKENRHKAYEDFAAVAQDLIARRVTSPKHLGAMGGSNGGLLMGNVVVRYPDLFHAVLCQVPLLDMKRYSHLLAGASWMGEYGDPDDPDQWSFIRTFSPYHLVKSDARYPRVLFTTSTRDDRVHPGHARKMFAKMHEMGHDVLYWENIEGGHGGAANNDQRATMWALSWTFLWNELK